MQNRKTFLELALCAWNAFFVTSAASAEPPRYTVPARSTAIPLAAPATGPPIKVAAAIEPSGLSLTRSGVENPLRGVVVVCIAFFRGKSVDWEPAAMYAFPY